MSWIPVKRIAMTHDLAPLSRFLHQRGLTHRITEEGQHQQLWVQDPALVEPMADLVDRWLAGELDLPEHEQRARRVTVSGPAPRTFPVTLVLLVLSALGALVGMEIIGSRWLPALTFQPIALTPSGPEFGPLGEALGRGEWWRLITPIFLHFSAFHILFNGLWLWELGRRLEAVLGPAHYLLFVLGTAVVANVGQFLGGPSLFGGMSGVVYAFVGFIWMRQKFAPHPMLAVPAGLIGFMLVWLVVCLTGVVDAFIGGAIANGAHLGGLLAGVGWGLATSGSGRR